MELPINLGRPPNTAAVNAIPPVHANRSPAFRTPPPDLLPFDELPESKLPDVFEVFYHAQSVFRSIAPVQLPQSGAGESNAIKAELPFNALHIFAIFYPACDTIFRLFGVRSFAARAAIFLSQITDTKTAIHPAGRNHRRFQACRSVLRQSAPAFRSDSRRLTGVQNSPRTRAPG